MIKLWRLPTYDPDMVAGDVKLYKNSGRAVLEKFNPYLSDERNIYYEILIPEMILNQIDQAGKLGALVNWLNTNQIGQTSELPEEPKKPEPKKKSRFLKD